MDKPLHVQVAEALGCAPKLLYGEWQCGCPEVRGAHYRRPHAAHAFHEECCHSHSGLGCDPDSLARYDTDWSVTGPLIKRFRLCLIAEWRIDTGSIWVARSFHGGDFSHSECAGSTPPLAICGLILALSKAGKLDAGA